MLNRVLSENAVLSDIVEQLAGQSLRSFYEIGRYLHWEVSASGKAEETSGEESFEGNGVIKQWQKEVNQEVQGWVVDCIRELRQIQMTDTTLGQSPGPLDDKSSAHSVPDEVSFGPKYLQRFSDMMAHARELFVADLSVLQNELSTSRKLLIHLHETTSM